MSTKTVVVKIKGRLYTLSVEEFTRKLLNFNPLKEGSIEVVDIR
jgi:hypothetical protein